MKKSILVFILFWFASPALWGYTYLGGSFLGDPVLCLDSRSLGMGGTGLAFIDSPSALRSNPAGIALSDRILFQANGNLFLLSEKIYIVTSAGSEIGYNDENINSQAYDRYYQLLDSAGLIVPVPLLHGLSVGVNWSKFLDFNYANSTYRYGSSQERTGIYDFEITDSVWAYAFGLGFNIKKLVWVGLSADLLNGTVFTENKVWEYPSKEHFLQSISEEKEMNGSRFSAGLIVALSRNTRLSAFYQTGPKISCNSASLDNLSSADSRGKYSITYPRRYGMGLAYSLLAGHNTTFAFDLIAVPWARDCRFKDDQDSSSPEIYLKEVSPYAYLADTYEMHLGAEHVLILVPKLLRMPLRYGLMWIPHYINDRVEMALFTLGLGFEGPYFFGQEIQIDLALGIGQRNFIGVYHEEPFDPPVEEELMSRVHESIQVIQFGLRVPF